MQSIEKKRNHIKKKTFFYKEQDPEKVKEYEEKTANIPKEKRIYVDETGIQKYIYREYGYAPKGEKIHAEIYGRKFKRVNIVAAKFAGKLIAPMQYRQSMTGSLFEFWFEHFLLPEVPEDAVIIVDNASFHRKKKLFEIADKHKRKTIFLPPYSPQLNPIEKSWAVLKRWLKFNLNFFDNLDDAISAYFQVN